MRLRLASLLMLMAFTTVTASAQQTTGTILGRVLDDQGATIPGAMNPGETELTRTPAADHSQAAVSVKVSMPPRAAPECANSGHPCQMSAIMFTMAPPFASIQRL